MADPIAPLLEGLTPAEQSDVKASALADIFSTANRGEGPSLLEYSVGDVTISIQTVEAVNGLLAVDLVAWDSNGDLPVPALPDRFYFKNPPIRVWTRVPGTNDAEDIGETAEDPENVAQSFIYDAVVAYATNHGWHA